MAALLKFRGGVQQVDIARKNLQTDYIDHVNILFDYSVPDLCYFTRLPWLRGTPFAGETADLDIHPTTQKNHTDVHENNRITLYSYLFPGIVQQGSSLGETTSSLDAAPPSQNRDCSALKTYHFDRIF